MSGGWQPKAVKGQRQAPPPKGGSSVQPPPCRVRATQQQLLDCIRAYQRANTREDMAKADALAERLVGKP